LNIHLHLLALDGAYTFAVGRPGSIVLVYRRMTRSSACSMR
jgi:hypothetical protein